MAKKAQKKTNKRVPSKPSEPRVKDFLDLIAPTAVKFNTDHYICGGTYRCTLALRSYPGQHRGAGPAPPPGGKERRDPAHL